MSLLLIHNSVIALLLRRYVYNIFPLPTIIILHSVALVFSSFSFIIHSPLMFISYSKKISTVHLLLQSPRNQSSLHVILLRIYSSDRPPTAMSIRPHASSVSSQGGLPERSSVGR